LGRPFLATAGAVIDVKDAKLTLQFGEEKVSFDMTIGTPIEIAFYGEIAIQVGLVKIHK
jgi:hypothetical protein